jgi:hypothetical protein
MWLPDEPALGAIATGAVKRPAQGQLGARHGRSGRDWKELKIRGHHAA